MRTYNIMLLTPFLSKKYTKLTNGKPIILDFRTCSYRNVHHCFIISQILQRNNCKTPVHGLAIDTIMSIINS